MGVQCRVHFIVSSAPPVRSNVHSTAQMIMGYCVVINEGEPRSLIPTQVLTGWMRFSALGLHTAEPQLTAT
jgi:hypothetical protein